MTTPIEAPKSVSTRTPKCGGWLLTLVAGIGCLTLGMLSAQAGEPRRVLVLRSYGSSFSPWTDVAADYRAELVKRSPDPVDFYEVSLDIARSQDVPQDAALVEYLRTHFSQRKFNLIVTLGQLPARFVSRYRSELFHDTPAVSLFVDQRRAPEANVGINDVVVAMDYDLRASINNILRVLPETKNLVMVLGNSPLDRSWVSILKREYAAFENRVNFEWFNDLTVDEMVKRAATLPADSAILYYFLVEDVKGVPYPQDRTLDALRAVANAPIFGICDYLLGRGIVGGPLIPTKAMASRAAEVSARIFGGEAPSAIKSPPLEFGPSMYDWRELRKWGINEALLSPGSIVQYRELPVWVQYRWQLALIAAAFLAQTMLVSHVLIQRRRRQLAEQSLAESEERMTYAAASANVGLWQFDPQTGELWATEHSRTLFGLPPAVPLTRETIVAAIYPDDREGAIAGMHRAASSGGSAGTDFRIVQPDGQMRWLRVRARAHPDDRSLPNQSSGIFADITEQKAAEAEAAEQRAEATHLMRVSMLGELSGAVTHELNQPLTAILSNAQAALHLLSKTSPDVAEVRDAIQDIVDANSRAGEVIQRLRNLLRKGEKKSEQVDLNELVNSTVALLKSELTTRGIKIEINLAHDLSTLTGDPVQLQQVLLNLLINAMDAMALTPEGLRVMIVSTHATGVGAIEVRVKDFGCGIRPVERARLFKPFYTTKDNGLGLGLTISSAIIHAHGGKLTLDNHDAGGAVAAISVPTGGGLVAAQ